MKLRIPQGAAIARFFLSPKGRIVAGVMAFVFLAALGTLIFFYAKYSKLVDQKLAGGNPFANTAKIFAAPRLVAVGDSTALADIVLELRRSGYNESRGNSMGYFVKHEDSLDVFPGPESYFDQEAASLRFASGKISKIVSLQDNTARNQYQLEPQLITAISERNREKRRIVKFPDIPKVLVNAVLAAEDKRFFQHIGLDPIRLVRAVYVDVKERRKSQGASTLSQQLARMFWLDMDKKWGRKMAEAIITLQIEQKLTKEQIFEFYANEIYLGWRGAFRVHGFGEAANAYLGKDLSQVTLPEAAMLAGMIQRPAMFDPFNHPDRTKERRNLVLTMMRQNGFITDREHAVAAESPLTAARGSARPVAAAYFVDMANDAMLSKFQADDFQNNGFRIYTSLDMDLQRAAEEAVHDGMQKVDELLKKQKRFKGMAVPEPQAALIALDPHTGEIKALVGGRNYGLSQLNHILAKRQPGSIFKPFVYAAALNTPLEGGGKVITAATTVIDEPTTFEFGGEPYEPGNFGGSFYGEVTLRRALAKSINVATVKVAEMVGYGAVVRMAKRAGFNSNIHATPSIALGSYDVMPLEAAGAYTVFANQGAYVKPSFVSIVRSQDGKVLYKNTVEKKQALDPRVAFLMTDLMQEVLRSGTAAGVRAQYNINVPAAGKTGTSHDGWFAGYTSDLLCVVWVGFDDYRDIELEGARSAAPIWGQFMKQALQYRPYRGLKGFPTADGMVTATVDAQTGLLATSGCPQTRTEYFIAGSEPTTSCSLHGGGGAVTHVAGWNVDGAAEAPAADPSADKAPQPEPKAKSRASRRRAAQEATARPAATAETADPAAPPTEQKDKPEKKGIFQKLWGVFK